jgi:hypothetical protein
VDSNTNPFGEFGDCYPLGEVRELANKLTCAGLAMYHLIPIPYCQMHELNILHWSLMSF